MKREAENVVRNEGKYLIVLINKAFGKIFKKVEIYPEKETKCPEPPFVGKYPNSRSVSCTGGIFVYVTKDKGQEVYDYYRERLKTHYKNVGFNFPEESWKFSGVVNSLGMQIKSSEVARVGIFLDPLRKEASIAPPPPEWCCIPYFYYPNRTKPSHKRLFTYKNILLYRPRKNKYVHQTDEDYISPGGEIMRAKAFAILFLFFVLVGFCEDKAIAWGPITHMTILDDA